MANEPLPVVYTPEFKRNLRQLARKYRSIRDDIDPAIEQIAAGQTPGDRISGVEFEVYKVRAPNSNARRGKSGGYRIIYQIKPAENVVLITIYSKSEQADIATAEIRRILDAQVEAGDDKGENGQQ